LTLTLSAPLNAAQAAEQVRSSLTPPLVMTFPVKPGNDVPQFPIDLNALIDIRVEGENRLVLDTKADVFDHIAYRWNKALSELPAKAVPRSQRLALSILGKKLTEEPTGQRMHDYARRRILDETQKGIGPTIALDVERRAREALGSS